MELRLGYAIDLRNYIFSVSDSRFVAPGLCSSICRKAVESVSKVFFDCKYRILMGNRVKMAGYSPEGLYKHLAF
jgi:hypothetical protein